MSASEPPNRGDAWIEVAPGRWKREYACTADELAASQELEEARAAEHELAFLTLLRAMVSHLMDAHEVESLTDLPSARDLVGKAIDECAVAKGIPPDVAAEIARRDLGFP